MNSSNGTDLDSAAATFPDLDSIPGVDAPSPAEASSAVAEAAREDGSATASSIVSGPHAASGSTSASSTRSRQGTFAGPAAPKYPIARPERTEPVRVLKPYAIGIPVVHVLSLLAVLPYFFSWTGVVLAIAGHYFFGLLGMTLGYHRLLTHRGFTCPKWFEHLLALLGVCCLQDSPARWVAVHRKHHQFSDERPDPHSPHVTFMWGHFGWLMLRNEELSTTAFYDRYARDLMSERFYRRLELNAVWVLVYFAHALLFVLAGMGVGWWTAGTLDESIRLGASYLVWGVFVRTVFVWHVTWAVNSVAHLFGYRNYETTDDSRNNWLVAMLAHGEGWHNNHHAEPRAAAHGHRAWEIDFTWIAIRLFEAIGLVKNVVRPKSWRDR